MVQCTGRRQCAGRRPRHTRGERTCWHGDHGGAAAASCGAFQRVHSPHHRSRPSVPVRKCISALLCSTVAAASAASGRRRVGHISAAGGATGCAAAPQRLHRDAPDAGCRGGRRCCKGGNVCCATVAADFLWQNAHSVHLQQCECVGTVCWRFYLTFWKVVKLAGSTGSTGSTAINAS